MHRYVLWLAVIALLWAAFSACELMPATRGYTDTRIDDVKAYAEGQDAQVKSKLSEAAVEVAEFVDPIAPGYAHAVEQVYAGKKITVSDLPERPDPLEPWMPIVSLALTALGVPISVGVTNHIRDKNRRKLGIPVDASEAIGLGFIDTNLRPIAAEPKVTA
jgi:hypothetical protein